MSKQLHHRWWIGGLEIIASSNWWILKKLARYGYGSIPINTIFRGMNIHLPAILMFTRGTRFWHNAISHFYLLQELQELEKKSGSWKTGWVSRCWSGVKPCDVLCENQPWQWKICENQTWQWKIHHFFSTNFPYFPIKKPPFTVGFPKMPCLITRGYGLCS